jgi:hypothetical protein
MKLLIQSAMIFFGTLMAAGLVALGEPGKAEVAIARSVSSDGAAQRNPHKHPWVEVVSAKARFETR